MLIKEYRVEAQAHPHNPTMSNPHKPTMSNEHKSHPHKEHYGDKSWPKSINAKDEFFSEVSKKKRIIYEEELLQEEELWNS